MMTEVLYFTLSQPLFLERACSSCGGAQSRGFQTPLYYPVLSPTEYVVPELDVTAAPGTFIRGKASAYTQPIRTKTTWTGPRDIEASDGLLEKSPTR